MRLDAATTFAGGLAVQPDRLLRRKTARIRRPKTPRCRTESAAMSRPMLLPGLRPLWRDRHTIQLGTDPGRSWVVELPHPSAAKLLDLLDGSRTEQTIVKEMRRLGLAPDEVRTALAALAEAGLIAPASSLIPTALPPELRERVAREATALALRHKEKPANPATILRRRYEARVIIFGDGPFADLLIPALVAAGIGTVGKVTEAGGTAKPVVSATRERTVRADDSFVIHLGWTARVTQRGAKRRLPVLALGARDGVAIVGPLVPPRGGPCLACLDLHRTDNDPAWPRLAVQAGGGPAPCASATMLTAAGFAAAEVLAYLDGGEPTTVGTTVEINGVAPWRRRSWSTHPMCDCTRRR